MSDPGIKWFQPSKCFAFGGLILCILIKEMSDPGTKWFQLLIFFCHQGAHIMCFNKGNARSWNKKFTTTELFSPAAGSCYVF